MGSGDVERVQLAVVGSGPGGYTAAFHAAELGMEVALVGDDPRPGGVCLLRGCIPTKALLHVAKLIYEARDAGEWGVAYGEPTIDLDRLRAWRDGVVDKLTGGLVELAKRRGVRLIHAGARFVDSHTLALEPKGQAGDGPGRLVAEKVIVATGSLPVMPGALRLDDPRVMDSTAAIALADVPKRLCVIGGGYIGLESAAYYAALGSEIRVVELTAGLLSGADRDLVRILQNRLSGQFAGIYLDTNVERLEARDDGIAVHLSGANVREAVQVFDRVLVAVGRRPNSSGLGLENTKVEIDDRGFVRIDRQRRTADPAIWAIGDVAGEPMLAHKAAREGKVAVESIAGMATEFDNVAIPAVVFTEPELAWCGLTETEARERGVEVEVARFPWGASGRAATLGRSDGMTKLIVEPGSQRVLGMGAVGPGAGELIGEGTLAVEMAAVARDLADTIHAHPTLSETIMEAAEVLFGHATHLYRPKRG